MNKINNNKIVFGLKILYIFAFGLIFMPFNNATAAPTYVYGHDNADGSYTFGDFVWGNSTSTNETNNPLPSVDSINPRFGNVNVNIKTITITGRGFIPSSIVRINNSSRSATFIDGSHLLVEITGNDIYTYRANGGFFISVFNGFPGGGYSNAAFFTVNNPSAAVNINNSNNYDYSTQIVNETSNTAGDQNYSNLASNAIFGSNGFLPSGLTQWVLFGIIILLIVIFARKIFSARENYDETPMKHA